MGKYLLRRSLQGIPILLGVSLVTFLLFHAFGGNPAYEFLGKNATAAEVEALLREYGLDQPLWRQYFGYLKEISTLDFGRSFVTKQPVRQMLWQGLGPSLSLTLPALGLTAVLAVGLALSAALVRGRVLDRALVMVAIVGLSVSFLVYIVVGQYLFAFRMPLFPIHGYQTGPVERWAYLALPIAIMTIVGFGYDTRYYRAVFIEEVGRESIAAARGRGLGPTRVLLHIFRNSLVPIITRVMISVPFLITGSLLLESFFGIPGLGSAMLDALNRSDFPVIKAYTTLISILFFASTMLTDVLYAWLDPRVRLS